MIHNNSGIVVLILTVILAWVAFVKRFDGPWWFLIIICAVVEVVIILLVTRWFNKIAEEY